MKIQILLDMGAPKESLPPEPAKPTMEQEVREAIQCIESGHDSTVEWKFINKLYKELRGMKPTDRISNLIAMMEPTMSKYGLHGLQAGNDEA